MYYEQYIINGPPVLTRGQQFGPLVVTRAERGWQIDHWPSGARMAPVRDSWGIIQPSLT